MAGVQSVRLNNLNINIKNALIVGIIIAKNSPRIMSSKKKNGETRGVTSFTLRDSEIDTIYADVWGSEYFVMTFYERFLVGDVVDVISPKINIKGGENDIYRPHVSSPFVLCLNEGQSEVCIHNGDLFSSYLPLLHIPTKPSSGYYGLAEVLKLPDDSDLYVDLLVVIKSVKPTKKIKTRTGQEMMVRSIEITDNTTPASLQIDIFDNDTIQRAEEWRPLESVIFIADARVRRRRIQLCGRSILTHQPHTADAEALRLHIKSQAESRGRNVEWSSGQCASVGQLRERAAAGGPFAADLNALLSHINLDDLLHPIDPLSEDLLVRFSDHTGEISARIPYNVIDNTFGYTCHQLKSMSPDDRNSVRWKYLLEQCLVKLATTAPPRFVVIALRRATPADPIPLY